MTTRLSSFRPRPVDINRQLVIVRDVSELDNTELVANLEGKDPQLEQAGTTQADLPEPLQGPPNAGQNSHKKKQKPKEIPIPDIKYVPTYTREYLPLYHVPDTYIRGKGGTGWAKDDYVEYDLDNEDEDWLEQYNSTAGASTASSIISQAALLSDSKFEKMLWKLDLACAEAMDRAMSAAGATASEKVTPAAVANTSYLSKEEAIAVMRKAVGGKEQALHDVYAYWLGKRKRHNRPLLRRLQAPTAATDTNPYNVFRPRERANRPQTRRRRENSTECLEKMRTIRENLMQALEVSELLVLRERKKREILRVDVGFQRLQLTLRHQARVHHEVVEQEAAHHLREAIQHNSQYEGRLNTYLEAAALHQSAGMSPAVDLPLHREIMRKRKRRELLAAMSADKVNRDAVAKLPPPPQQPADQEMVFAMRPDPDRLPAAAIAPLLQSDPGILHSAKTRWCWRIARGGRLMLTRVDPLTMQRLVCGDEEAESGAAAWRRPPPPSQRLGALPDWWESPSGSERPVPWATSLDLAKLPMCVDGEALLHHRQLQLQQHHAETAALGALAGNRLGVLGNTNPTTLATAAAAATSAAHAQLQQQLQAAMAEDAAVLASRTVAAPAPAGPTTSPGGLSNPGIATQDTNGHGANTAGTTPVISTEAQGATPGAPLPAAHAPAAVGGAVAGHPAAAVKRGIGRPAKAREPGPDNNGPTLVPMDVI